MWHRKKEGPAKETGIQKRLLKGSRAVSVGSHWDSGWQDLMTGTIEMRPIRQAWLIYWDFNLGAEGSHDQRGDQAAPLKKKPGFCSLCGVA